MEHRLRIFDINWCEQWTLASTSMCIWYVHIQPINDASHIEYIYDHDVLWNASCVHTHILHI